MSLFPIPRDNHGGVLVTPDILLPVQHATRSVQRSGARRLQIAVLQEALDNLVWVRRAGGTTAFGRRLEAWFASEDRSWPFAFVPLCEALSFEPEAIRTHLGITREMAHEPSRSGCVSAGGRGTKASVSLGVGPVPGPSTPRRCGGRRSGSTMDQLGFAFRPIAAHRDPAPSHVSAEHVEASGQLGAEKAQTLQALARHIGPPPTSRELAGADVDLRYVYGRRLPDLEGDKLVAKSGERLCAISQRKATTWRLTIEGCIALRQLPVMPTDHRRGE